MHHLQLRTRDGKQNGHFAEGLGDVDHEYADDHPSDEDAGGATSVERRARADEETGADGSADGDHLPAQRWLRSLKLKQCAQVSALHLLLEQRVVAPTGFDVGNRVAMNDLPTGAISAP